MIGQVSSSQNSLVKKLPENILRAVLENLVKNSIEAIEENSQTEGELTLELKKSKSGLEWILALHDSGVGFPLEFLQKPIQSFATSKAQGSGLGLATAQKMLGAYNVQLKILSPNAPYSTSLFLIGNLIEATNEKPETLIVKSDAIS